MLLIEMEGQNSPRFRLEFHPRLTVVSQLSPEMRMRIASSLNSTLFGDPSDLSMMVDYNGIPQPLTNELLARAGMLRKPMDNIISAADLPGAILMGESQDLAATPAIEEFLEEPVLAGVGATPWEPLESQSDRAPRHIRESTEGSPLENARAELEEAEAYAEELMQKIEASRAGRFDVTEEDVERALDSLKQARSIANELKVQIQDLQDQMDNPTRESKVVRVMRLRQVESSIDERIHQLREALEGPGADRSEVQRCLDAVSNVEQRQDLVERRNLVERLAQRLAEETALIERLESQPRPPAWLVAQTKGEIEEAEARIAAFSYQVKEGIDVKKALKKAQEQLTEAQLAWNELEDGVEGELRIARERRDDSVRALAELLNVDPETDMNIAVEGERNRLANADDPRVELVAALAKFNIESTVHTAVELATVWIDEQSSSEAAHSGLQQQIATALLDLGAVRKQIADINNESESLNDRSLITAKIEMLQGEYAEAQSALRECEANHTDLAARVVVRDPEAIKKLEAEYEETQEIVVAAGRKVDYFASLEALRHDGEVAPATAIQQEGDDRPWWEERVVEQPATNVPTPAFKPIEVDVSQIDESDTEMYVLARVAGLRAVANGEPVPLIIDGAFDDVAPHFALRLFDALEKLSSAVQIVYLSSGSIAERWVNEQDEMVAAKVTVENL